MPEQLNLVDHGDSVAKAAFRMLLDDPQPLPMRLIASRLELDPGFVSRALDGLTAVGRAETREGELLGVYGLTLKPTQHSLELGEKQYYTWCAFDIVGIPAALGASARVSSRCGGCDREIRFEIADGDVPALPLVISWLSRECDSIRADFCPSVNFFCDHEEYAAAAAAKKAPTGSLTLEQAASMGRENWGWARSE